MTTCGTSEVGPASSRAFRWNTAVTISVLICAGTVLYFFDPATTPLFPSCPLRTLTGLLCPLCGTLRAVHALLHGEIVTALLLNPFVFAFGLLGPMLPFRWTAAAALAFTVMRNVP